MTHDYHDSRDDNLKRMITLFLKKAEMQRLRHNELRQLCFLAELNLYKNYGYRISDCKYVKATEGISSRDFNAAIRDLRDYIDLYDDIEYRKTYEKGPNWKEEYESTIDHILRETDKMMEHEIISKVDSCDMVKNAEVGESIF